MQCFKNLVWGNIYDKYSTLHFKYFMFLASDFCLRKKTDHLPLLTSICRAPWTDNNQLWDDKRTLDQGWIMMRNKSAPTGDHQTAAIVCFLAEFVFVCLFVCFSTGNWRCFKWWWTKEHQLVITNWEWLLFFSAELVFVCLTICLFICLFVCLFACLFVNRKWMMLMVMNKGAPTGDHQMGRRWSHRSQQHCCKGRHNNPKHCNCDETDHLWHWKLSLKGMYLGVALKESKRIFILLKTFRKGTTHFRFDHFYMSGLSENLQCKMVSNWPHMYRVFFIGPR